MMVENVVCTHRPDGFVFFIGVVISLLEFMSGIEGIIRQMMTGRSHPDVLNLVC